MAARIGWCRRKLENGGSVAEVKANQPGPPENYPVAWASEYQRARIWYTNMGHYAENFRQPEFIKHLLDGIAWVSNQGH